MVIGDGAAGVTSGSLGSSIKGNSSLTRSTTHGPSTGQIRQAYLTSIIHVHDYTIDDKTTVFAITRAEGYLELVLICFAGHL